MTDGALPFRNFTDSYTEKPKKMMKATQIFDDSKKPLVKTVKKIQGKG